jgi:hypothetical protein
MADSTFSVVVPGKIGRSYTLQRESFLGSDLWTTIRTKGPMLETGPVTLNDPDAVANQGFYRVAVEWTPP